MIGMRFYFEEGLWKNSQNIQKRKRKILEADQNSPLKILTLETNYLKSSLKVVLHSFTNKLSQEAQRFRSLSNAGSTTNTFSNTFFCKRPYIAAKNIFVIWEIHLPFICLLFFFCSNLIPGHQRNIIQFLAQVQKLSIRVG